jgi:hypothetical protein
MFSWTTWLKQLTQSTSRPARRSSRKRFARRLTVEQFEVRVVPSAVVNVSDAHISISGATGTGGAFKIGDTVTAAWDNSANGDNNASGELASKNPVAVDFSQFGGPSAQTAWVDNLGIWRATYTIEAGSIDASNCNVSVTVTDSASQSTTTPDTTNATVDNIAPTVTDARISISGATGTGGAFKIGDTVTARWNNTAFMGDKNDAGELASKDPVTVDFSQFGGPSAVVAANSDQIWTASYPLVAGTINSTNLNVAVTVTDNAGNSTTTADSTRATVDTIQPAVAIAAVTSPITSANQSVVSASGKAEAGATVSVAVSDGAGHSTAPRITTAGADGTWSVTGIDVSTLLDGTITYTATASDAAGNTKVAKATATKDAAAPAVAITAVTSPVNSKNQGAVSASGTAEAGATVSVAVSDGAGHSTAQVMTTAGDNGTWSVAGIVVSGLNDGTITYTATAKDAAGNTRVFKATATKDVVAPAVAITAVTDLVTSANQSAVSASGTAEAGATVSVVVSDGGVPNHNSLPRTTTAGPDGTWSVTGIDASGLNDGTITYTATATDPAGNRSEATATATKDTLAPITILVSAPVINSANAHGVVVTGTTNTPNASIAVSIKDGTTPAPRSVTTMVTAGADGAWSATLDASRLADGPITYSAAGTVPGHTGPAATASRTKDTAAPTTTLVSTPVINSANADGVLVTGTTDTPGASIAVSITDGATPTPHVVSTTVTAGADGAWSATLDASALLDGAVTYSARATDAAGNAGAAAAVRCTKDSAAPAAPKVTSPTQPGAVNAPSCTIAGTAEAGSTVNVYRGGAVVGTGTAAGGNFAITVSLAQNAVNSFTVTATDAAGNESAAAAVAAITEDSSIPDAPTVTSPSHPVAVNAPSYIITGKAEAGSTVKARSGGAVVGSGTADLGGNFAISVSLTASAVNSFTVTAVDAAGNVSAAAAVPAITEDSTAPAPPTVALAHDTGSSSADKITSDGALAVGGTEAGAAVQYSIDGGTTWAGSFTATQGVNSVQVRQADVAGNVSPATAFTFTLDTTAAAPTVALASDTGSSSADRITKDGTLALGGTETGATVEYSIDGGVTWTGSFTATQGVNSVQVRQTDVAGNVSPVTTFAFTLDTTAAAPTVALASDTGSSSADKITKDGTLAVGGTETGAAVQYSIDGGVTWAGSFTATQGVNTVQVRQIDVAGNASPATAFTFTLDAIAPAAPTVALAHDTGSSSADKITSDGALAVSGTEAGAAVQYSTNGGVTWSGSFTATQGVNTVQVRQIDVAGNASAPTAYTFTLDRIAPAAPAVASPSQPVAVNAPSYTIAGTAEAGSTVQVHSGGAVVGTGAADPGGNYAISVSLTADAVNSFTVTATDAAGNVSAATAVPAISYTSSLPAWTDVTGQFNIAVAKPSRRPRNLSLPANHFVVTITLTNMSDKPVAGRMLIHGLRKKVHLVNRTISGHTRGMARVPDGVPFVTIATPLSGSDVVSLNVKAPNARAAKAFALQILTPA